MASKYVRTCKWDKCGRTFGTNDFRKQYCCKDHQKRASNEARIAKERESAKKKREIKAEQARLHPNAWQMFVSDPFTRPDFFGADGLPGMHSQVCPMEGMYSQPENQKEAA
jgi:hypothetical protein